MKKHSVVILTVIIFAFSLLSCAKEDEKKEPDNQEIKIDEGTDTKCEVSYSSYEGDHKEMFLSKGDKIAVIAPSSRPSKEQTDITIEGLKEWGYVPVAGSHVYDEVCSFQDIMDDLKWALEDKEIMGEKVHLSVGKDYYILGF